MLDPKLNVAVYMEGHIDSDYGKMGMGVVRYLKNPIVGIVDSKFAGKNIYEIDEFNDINKDIKVYKNLKQVVELGAKVLILGIAPSGGKIPKEWDSIIEEAIDSGLSLVNGLHDLLSPKWDKRIKDKKSQWIWDVRVPQFIPEIATGKVAKIKNKRVLFIGTDMAVGKMTAGLELYKDLTVVPSNKSGILFFITSGLLIPIVTEVGVWGLGKPRI